jgi:hypothetical protein
VNFSGAGRSENGEGQALRKYRIFRAVEKSEQEYGGESA